MLYAWSPPQIGLDVTILQALEDALRDELNTAVGDISRDCFLGQNMPPLPVPVQIEEDLEDLDLEDYY